MAVRLLERCRSVLRQHLALCIFILFAAQPAMDILSFWQEKLGMGSSLSLLLRMLVLAATALAGYLLSERRRYYWYLAAVCAGFFALHAAACGIAGYVSPFADLTNYVRVIQIPLFTVCFISFLRADPRVFRWIKTGFFLSFGLITVVVLLSVVTGTNPHTYADTQSGVLGWFLTTNSQASIMSMLTPILLCMAYRAKNLWILVLIAVLSCGQLYLLGTRLAYMAIFASTLGILFVTAVCGRADRRKYAVLVLVAAVSLAGFKVSPMYEHQMSYGQTMQEKQDVLNSMTADRGGTVLSGEEEQEETDLAKMRQFNQIYVYYRSDLVQRFGVEKVMENCDFSTDVSEITGARMSKIMFCSLLMDEEAFPSRLFGLERDTMVYKGEMYDPENDFHGIYYLYGFVGLVLLLAFLAYFLYLIGWALAKDARKYFTLDAGAFGLSLLLAFVNAYNTAGILRRPNASFYLSVLLAVIYYLVKIKKYPAAAKSRGIRLPELLRRKKTV